MMPWLTPEVRVLLAALAVYRLAQLLSLDDGPLAVFARVRRWSQAHPAAWGGWRWSVAEWLACPFCQGVWWAAVALPLLVWPTAGGDLFLLWLALAGAQSWLEGRRS